MTDGEAHDWYVERGRNPPDKLKPPKIADGLSSVLRAFWELDSERPTGWSIGQIPTRAIISYADKYGPRDLDGFDSFMRLIRAADAAYLEKTRKPK